MAKIIVYGTKIVTDTTNGLCVESEGAPPPPPPVYTDEAFFTFDSATRTITDYSSEGPKDVVIPPTIGGVPVEVIGESAMRYMDLTSIVLPSSLLSLEECAMDGNLITSIEIPASVTYIGEWALCDSPNLTQVILHEGLTELDDYAFQYCYFLSQVNLPNSLRRIGERAFEECALTSVTIPDGVTDIGKEAFAKCALTSVIIPDSVTNIGSGAFRGLTQADITLGAGFPHFWLATGTRLDGAIGSDPNIPAIVNGEVMTEIGERFFYDQLFAPDTHIIIPDGYEVISYAAFQLPHNITEVFIPDSVKVIGSSAFTGNGGGPVHKQITTVRVGDAVELEGAAFSRQPITSVTLGDACTISAIASVFGNYGNALRTAYINNGRAAATYTYENGAWSPYTPEMYFTFSEGQIRGYSASGPKDVVIPPTIGGVPVTGIATYAMADELNLTSVVIPDSVTTIGEGAFQYNQLTALIIPDSVTSIGAMAFYGNNIATLHIGSGVETIGSNAFAENDLTSLTIPNNVVSIGSMCFYGNYSLTTVTLSDSMTTIPESAFGETAIQSITMNSITVVESSAFSNAPLTSVTLGESVSINPASPTMGVNTGFCDAYFGASSTSGTYVYNESAVPWAQWEKL